MKSKRHGQSRIDTDTPVQPHIIAACVCEEAGIWLGEPLPRRWIRELAAEAATVYTHCERFRNRVRGSEIRGRDYLWMFMRHWLSAKLWERRPWLHARLPAGYARGEELPASPSVRVTRLSQAKRRPMAGMQVRLLSAISL